MNIATEYTRINNAKKDIINSLQNKNVIVPSDARINNLSVLIDSIPNGVNTDITFYDYDGTPLYAYSFEDIQKLTSLPALPHHEGLIAQEWNWTLEELKSANHKCVVGANYITNDGKTRFYVDIVKDASITFSIYLTQTVDRGVTINWGDGSSETTIAGTGQVSTTHTYTKQGQYLLTLNPKDNCKFSFGHGADDFVGEASVLITGVLGPSYVSSMATISKIELGKNISQLNTAAFNRLGTMKTISIPSYITEIRQFAFRYCRLLSAVVFPRNIKKVKSYMFYDDYNLRTISIPSGIENIENGAFYLDRGLLNFALGNKVKTIGVDSFRDCYVLQELNLTNNLISIGTNALSGCRSLKKLSIPSSVTELSGGFDSLQGMTELELPTKLATICAFPSPRALRRFVFPKDLTILPASAASGSEVLAEIVLPDNVTWIGQSAFSGNYALTHMKYPSTLNNLQQYVCYGCGSIVEHDFSLCKQIPTLANVNVFENINANCKIKVPKSLYNQWKVATNWSAFASYMVAV